MPNHVTTRCIVTGPAADVDAFYARMIVTTPDEDGKPYTRLDFGQIIPMPAVASEVVENGIAPDVLVLLSEASGMHDVWERLRGFDRAGNLGRWKGLFNFEKGEIADRLEKAFPGCIANARAMARCIGETGCKSWYDWSIKHWGSKWNSYSYSTVSYEPERLEIMFDTAWSFPHPVFRKLCEVFSTLTFDCVSYDEGSNFAIIGKAKGADYAIEQVAATDELYERVHGRKPERDDEDAEAENA